MTSTTYGNYPGTTTISTISWSGTQSGTVIIGVPITVTTVRDLRFDTIRAELMVFPSTLDHHYHHPWNGHVNYLWQLPVNDDDLHDLVVWHAERHHHHWRTHHSDGTELIARMPMGKAELMVLQTTTTTTTSSTTTVSSGIHHIERRSAANLH